MKSSRYVYFCGSDQIRPFNRPNEINQIFHHWTSYAMFALALVHTFPFIVYNISKGDMVQEWKTSVVYWTGAIAIIAQAYLTFMSLPGIR